MINPACTPDTTRRRGLASGVRARREERFERLREAARERKLRQAEAAAEQSRIVSVRGSEADRRDAW